MDALLNTATAKTGGDISNVYLLNDAHEAFVARAALIEAADHTLDLQYYIWHNDISGKLMFNLIHRAAERGVRVRLLLDDNNTNGLDNVLLALDSHPNIEIRLFNPFVRRKWRALGYLTDFPPPQPPDAQQILHRRQPRHHPRRAQYGDIFKFGEDTIFADLDILATGRVVTEVSQDLTAIGQAIPPTLSPASSKKGDIEKRLPRAGVTTTKTKTKPSAATAAASKIPNSTKKMQSNSIDWQSVHTPPDQRRPRQRADRDRHKPPIFDRMQTP